MLAVKIKISDLTMSVTEGAIDVLRFYNLAKIESKFF